MSATLQELWRATVQREPNRMAVVTAGDGRAWTRAQVADAVSGWQSGVPGARDLAGRRVAMAAANGIGWWQAFLGLLDLGAIPVLVDASEPGDRQLRIAREAGACALWTDGGWVAIRRGGRSREPDACLIKLTSGSTGRPRAWLFTHGQMLSDGAQICSTMGITPEDTNLAAIPLGHSYGMGNIVIPFIAQGTAMVIADSPLPHVLAGVCSRWRPTVFPAVPVLLDALCRSEAEPGALSSLRLVISAGAQLPAALARAFNGRFGRMVHNFYGASETGGIGYDRTGEATLAGRSVGTPMDGVRIRWGKGGRFHVESGAVAGSGSFSPQDLGALSGLGELVLLGRAGRLVKIGARRVDLGEVEAALRSVPGVEDSYAETDPASPELIAAAVATRLSPAQVRAALQERLSPWKLPHRLHAMPALPVTSRGKPDRVALRALMFRQEGA